MRYLFILLLFISVSSFGQKPFEGVITYRHALMEMPEDLYYTHKVVHIKSNGFYKHVEYADSTTTKFRAQIYHPTDTILYHNQTTGFNKALYNVYWWQHLWDKRNYIMITPPDTFYTVENGDEVLGRKCHLLVFDFGYKTQIFSYDPNIYVPASNFMYYMPDYLDLITKIIKSYPLRTILIDSDGVIIGHWVATGIEEKRVKKKLFKIPKNAELRKTKVPIYGE